MKLVAPNGKKIVRTLETMDVGIAIDVLGVKEDGTYDLNYNDHEDYCDSIQQKTDERGKLLYLDTDGIEWPEDKLTLHE